jgi:hypothetical protein
MSGMPDEGGVWPRRRWFLLTAGVVLVLGALVASQVDAALGLRTVPAAVPSERMVAVKAAPAVEPPHLTSIVLPADGSDLDRRRERLAAEAVASALAARDLPKPKIGEEAEDGQTLRVETGASLTAPSGKADQTFGLRKRGGGLVLQAATSAGAANGLYAVADRHS